MQADVFAGANARLDQRVRQTVRAFIQLGIRKTAIADDQRFAIWNAIGDRFEKVGQIERHREGS
jgi:fructose/tagatose bisphosphate aldolase